LYDIETLNEYSGGRKPKNISFNTGGVLCFNALTSVHCARAQRRREIEIKRKKNEDYLNGSNPFM
jgi:hypothetical protein